MPWYNTLFLSYTNTLKKEAKHKQVPNFRGVWGGINVLFYT